MSVKTKRNDYVIDKQVDNYRLYNRYKLLALNMFKWEGLPKGIKSRHIENALYEYGQVVFYNHRDYGFIVVPCSPTGTPNVLNDDVYVNALGYNNVETIKLVESKESIFNLDYVCQYGVRCLNNDLAIPTKLNVIDYANKMNEVEKAIDLNISQQKFPYIIFSNTGKQFSMQQLMKDVEEGKPVIYADNKITFDDLQCFNINVPFVVDRLQDYKKDLEQEILNYFALSSTNNKRERMLVDELNLNNDYKDRTCELMYQQRLEFCKIANKIYGTKMRVLKFNDVVDSQRNDNNVSRETMGEGE